MHWNKWRLGPPGRWLLTRKSLLFHLCPSCSSTPGARRSREMVVHWKQDNLSLTKAHMQERVLQHKVVPLLCVSLQAHTPAHLDMASGCLSSTSGMGRSSSTVCWCAAWFLWASRGSSGSPLLLKWLLGRREGNTILLSHLPPPTANSNTLIGVSLSYGWARQHSDPPATLKIPGGRWKWGSEGEILGAPSHLAPGMGAPFTPP